MSETIPLIPVLAQAESPPKPAKDGAAAELARKRAAKLSPERRSEIAKNAAKARWAKKEDAAPEKAAPTPRKKRQKKKH